MAISNVLNKGGIAPANTFAGSTAFATGRAPPISTTQGTDTTPVVTEEYVCEVYIDHNHQSTGFSLLNGSAVAGNVTAILYDSNGGIVANSASTAQSGTAALQDFAWASAPQLKGPAKYFVGVRFDSTSARFRSHIIGKFAASKKTAQTYATLTALTVPTTFTTVLGPVGSLY